MNNRLQTAWETRLAIYRFLKAKGQSEMSAIASAFPDLPHETLRKTLHRMRAELAIAIVKGRCNIARYSATSTEPKPKARASAPQPAAKKTRTQTRQKPVATPQKKRKTRQAKDAQEPDQVQTGPRIETIAPGHIRVHPGDRPIPNQRGQGALRGKATINCGHNY